MLTDKLEWWNIVPHEREADGADNEVDDEVGAGGHHVPVKLLDLDDSDFFHQSELLELKELSNLQKAMSAVAGDQDKSDEKLFPNSQLTVNETVILLLGIITRHKLSGVALDDILQTFQLSRFDRETHGLGCQLTVTVQKLTVKQRALIR